MTRAKDISKIVSDANFGGTLDVGGAFTSLGIDDNANATAITIDSSENVLVGTTTVLTAENNVEGISLASGSYGGLLSVSRASARSATFNRKTNDGDIVEFRKDGTAVGSIGYSSATNIYIGNASRGIGIGGSSIFPTNGSTAVSDGGLSLGYGNGKWNNLYLSGGAYLGGTGAINLLDDYEEGTWTPQIADAAGNVATVNVLSTGGSYTKIGNIVTLTGRVMSASVSGVGDPIFIKNLPFPAISGEKGYATLAISQAFNLNITGGRSVVASIAPGAVIAALRVWDNASGNTGMTAAEWSDDGYAMFSGSYTVA